jgi:hypothetical protein
VWIGEDAMTTDFWANHGILFLLGMGFLPRITMLLMGTFHGFGALGWTGWVFAPHVTVAVIATNLYWHTNPVLCVLAWLVAFGGTSKEVQVVGRERGRARNG